jgi:hypothetical protein
VVPGRLSTFIDQLHLDGSVAVAATGPVAEEDARDLEAALTRACDRAVAEAPAGMPAPDRQSAQRAFAVLYDLCRLVINRHLPIEALAAAGAPWDPAGATVAEIFAVDVAFRHLHVVHRQAAERSPDDPLVQCLLVHARAWAVRWWWVYRVNCGSIACRRTIGSLLMRSSVSVFCQSRWSPTHNHIT